MTDVHMQDPFGLMDNTAGMGEISSSLEEGAPIDGIFSEMDEFNLVSDSTALPTNSNTLVETDHVIGDDSLDFGTSELLSDDRSPVMSPPPSLPPTSAHQTDAKVAVDDLSKGLKHNVSPPAESGMHTTAHYNTTDVDDAVFTPSGIDTITEPPTTSTDVQQKSKTIEASNSPIENSAGVDDTDNPADNSTDDPADEEWKSSLEGKAIETVLTSDNPTDSTITSAKIMYDTKEENKKTTGSSADSQDNANSVGVVDEVDGTGVDGYGVGDGKDLSTVLENIPCVHLQYAGVWYPMFKPDATTGQDVFFDSGEEQNLFFRDLYTFIHGFKEAYELETREISLEFPDLEILLTEDSPHLPHLSLQKLHAYYVALHASQEIETAEPPLLRVQVVDRPILQTQITLIENLSTSDDPPVDTILHESNTPSQLDDSVGESLIEEWKREVASLDEGVLSEKKDFLASQESNSPDLTDLSWKENIEGANDDEQHLGATLSEEQATDYEEVIGNDEKAVAEGNDEYTPRSDLENKRSAEMIGENEGDDKRGNSKRARQEA